MSNVSEMFHFVLESRSWLGYLMLVSAPEDHEVGNQFEVVR
jgi:hypothetical protein